MQMEVGGGMTNQPAGTPDVRRSLKYDDQYSDSYPKILKNRIQWVKHLVAIDLGIT